MNLKDVKIDLKETVGELMITGEAKEIFVYRDKKKTDEVEAIAYPVISTKIWEKFTIKTKKYIQDIEYHGKPIAVELENPQAKLWQDFKSGQIRMSITADNIIPSQNNKLRMNKVGKSDEV